MPGYTDRYESDPEPSQRKLLARLEEDEARTASGLLATIPVLSAAAAGLSTALAALPGSWWVLDPANWPAGDLLFRVRFTAILLTNGDVIGATLFDAAAAGNLLPEFTKTAVGTEAETVSAWTPFPTTKKSGYAVARNSTAARGSGVAVSIQVKAS